MFIFWNTYRWKSCKNFQRFLPLLNTESHNALCFYELIVGFFLRRELGPPVVILGQSMILASHKTGNMAQRFSETHQDLTEAPSGVTMAEGHHYTAEHLNGNRMTVKINRCARTQLHCLRLKFWNKNTEEQQVHKGATTERYQHGAWYRNTMCSETIMLERNAK